MGEVSMYQNGCNAYRQSAVNIVEEKPVIVIKLYGGALKFITNAKRGIAEKSPRVRGEYISKVMAIVNELNCALDMERGGKLASQLDSLYQFVMEQLSIANIKNDLKALDQAEHILEMLKEGFEGAYDQIKRAGSTQKVVEETRPAQEGVRCAL
jgi:flagellar protein FliS